MKKALLAVLIVGLLAFACSPAFFLKFDATAKILNHELWQNAYAKIEYEVTNTGEIDIDYYVISFEIVCTDGTVINDSQEGWELRAGAKKFGTAYIYLLGKTYQSVAITKLRITNIDYVLEKTIEF